MSPMKVMHKNGLCGQLNHNKRICKSNHASRTNNMGQEGHCQLQLHLERERLLVGLHNLKIIMRLMTPIFTVFIENIEQTDCWLDLLVLYIGLVS